MGWSPRAERGLAAVNSRGSGSGSGRRLGEMWGVHCTTLPPHPRFGPCMVERGIHFRVFPKKGFRSICGENLNVLEERGSIER